LRLTCEAFAKVNRTLLVLGKRPDGYHELDTVFQSVDLADRLAFEDPEELKDFELRVSDPSLAGEDNLVARAARALGAEAGVPCRGRVTLDKRIPWGAGLGGGSADAAAALRGFAALWQLAVPEGDLHRLAADLGSDVPFFLIGGRARGTGRGEVLTPLADGPPDWLVLLSPSFPLSTPAVYRALGAGALTGPAAPSILSGSCAELFPDRNDLEPAAESLRGEVRQLRDQLLAAGAQTARLSGSGSTVFGVFPDPASASRAAAALTGSLPGGTRITVVKALTREEYQRRSTPGVETEETGVRTSGKSAVLGG